MRLLVRAEEPIVHAYATSRDSSFYLVGDDSFWAYEHDGHLWLAGTREPIARRVQNVFYCGERPLFVEE